MKAHLNPDDGAAFAKSKSPFTTLKKNNTEMCIHFDCRVKTI